MAIAFSIKSNNQNTLSVLRYKILPIEYLKKDFIIKFFKGFTINLKGTALIMAAQIFNVFKHKGLWPLCF